VTSPNASTRRWRELRAAQLKREPWCRLCALRGERTRAVEVDHHSRSLPAGRASRPGRAACDGGSGRRGRAASPDLARAPTDRREVIGSELAGRPVSSRARCSQHKGRMSRREGHSPTAATRISARLSCLSSWPSAHDLGDMVEDFERLALRQPKAQAPGDGVHVPEGRTGHRLPPRPANRSCWPALVALR
jgi:hypothetical protein